MKRKKHIIVMITVITACFVVMALVNEQNSVDVSNLEDESSDNIIVLDAGHGGEDGGAVSSNGVVESDINLQFTQKLKYILSLNGYEIVMTREDDDSLKNNKAEDMRERAKIIDESKANIAVSIHQNSFSSEAEKGAQVFYYSKSEEGIKIAQILQNHLKMLNPDNKREIKENNSYFLLKRTKTPTVIVECGFLSNWEEAEKLTKTEYQKELAQVISEGILAYINQE